MDFKVIIKEQRYEMEKIEKEERIIKRDISEAGAIFLKHPNILAVVGVRRCGKSILSYLLGKRGNFGYINFDDERLVGIKTDDLNRIMESFYELYGDVEYVILDEIQNAPNWELFANRLRRTKKVIITGSNSKLLSGELATHLTGRYIDIKLFPFSFREFLDLNQFENTPVGTYTTMEKANILRFLNEYLNAGGFPEVNKFGYAILRRIYDDIITKDVLIRHGIKQRENLRNLSKYLITNFSSEITYRKLAKILGVGHVSTVSNWISYLEDSFLIIKLERFSFKLKRQFVAPKKIYCIDNGIANMIGFKFIEKTGKLMENAVAVELQRKKAADHSSEIYYWRDHQQNEVDFVIKKADKIKQLIQVTYAASKDDIREREIKSLLKGSEELACENLVVITWDYESVDVIKNSDKGNKNKKIKFIPLWKWLMATDYGDKMG